MRTSWTECVKKRESLGIFFHLYVYIYVCTFVTYRLLLVVIGLCSNFHISSSVITAIITREMMTPVFTYTTRKVETQTVRVNKCT